MTHPEGSGEEGISWLQVAASAAGIAEHMKQLGTVGGDAFKQAFRASSGDLGTAGSGIENMVQGIGDSGSKAGRAFTANLQAALRAGDADVQASLRSFREAEAEAQRALAATNSAYETFKANRSSSDAAEQARMRTDIETTKTAYTAALAEETRAHGALDDAVNHTSGSVEHLGGSMQNLGGIAQGALGGAVVLGGQAAVHVFEDMLEATEKVADGIFKIGENWEEVNRQLVATTTASGSALAGLKDVIGQVSEATSQSLQNTANDVAVLSQRTGLAGAPLQKLATDVAQAGDIMGKAVDPAKFAAAAAAMGVPADQMSDYLTRLVGLSRATAVPLNDLIDSLQKNGAALSVFGVDGEHAAAILAQMTAGGISSERAMRGLRGVVTLAHKDHQDFATTLRQVVGHMEDLHKAGNKIEEDRWAESLGGGVIELEAAVNNGTLSVQSLSGALADIPLTPIPELHEQTETLSDRLTELGHRINTDLAPIGESLTSALGGAFDHLSQWVDSHGPEITDWLKTLGGAAIWVGGQMVAFVGDLTDAAGELEEAYGWLTGNEATMKAGEHLSDLGRQMSQAGQNTDALTKSFYDMMDAAAKSITISEDLKDAVKLGPDGKGLELTDSKQLQEDLKALHDAGVDISKGPDGKITFQVDTPENQKAVDDFKASIGDKDTPVTLVPKPTAPGGVGPPPADPGALFNIPPDGIKVPLIPVPQGNVDFGPGGPLAGTPAAPGSRPTIPDTQAPPAGGYPSGQFMPGAHNPGDWLYRLMGGAPIFAPDQPPQAPPAQPAPVVPLPPPVQSQGPPMPAPPAALAPSDLGGLLGAAPSSYVLPIPGQITIQAAKYTTPMPDVLGSAGIPTSNQAPLGVTLPTGLPLQKTDDLDPADLMNNAGIADKYQDDDGQQVQFPTGLHVSPMDKWLSAEEMMDGAGVAPKYQGPDGVIIPASFELAAGTGGTPGVVPAGFTGGAPGSSGSRSGINWNAIAGAESGGDWQITHGQGPDVTGGLQIATATWLSHGGGAYAPKAYLATPQQQISVAQSIIDDPTQGPGAWPTTYKNHPEWFGTTSSSAAGGSQPGGMPGASVSYTPDWMEQHGFAPILQKTTPDASGAQIPASVQALAAAFGLTASDHADTSLHAGRAGPGNTINPMGSYAFDFSGAVANEQAFADAMKGYAGQIAQEIWQNPDTGQDTGIAGGQILGQGQYYTTPGGSYADHRDHVHVGFTSVPTVAGPAANATANAVPVDYTTPTAPPPDNTTWTVDRTTPDPGTTPAPTAPGSSYASIPPPPDMPQAPAGAPGAIQTPYGNFQYTRDMPDQGMGLTPELREKFDTWLRQFEHLAEQQTSTQQDIDDLQARLADGGDLAQKKADADTAAADPNAPPDDKAAAQAADREYADAQKQLANLKRRQHDEQVDADIAADKKPPWESSSKTDKDKPDKNAEDLGKGLVSGIMQEFGFPDVFGKGFNNWGITKLLGGIGGFALGKLGQLADGQAGGGSAAGTSGGTDGGGASFLEGLFPGLKTIMHGPNNGTPAGTPVIPGAPAPASNTPAGAGSSTPVVLTARDSGPGTTTNSNLHVYNQYNGFNPTPRVQDQVQQIAATTSAPAMSGGGGQLI